MRTRPVWTFYILTLLSSGLFMYVWIHLLMTQINELSGRMVFPTKWISTALAMGIAAYFGGIALMLAMRVGPSDAATLGIPAGVPPGFVAPLAILGLTLVLAAFVLIALVERHVRRASGQAFGLRTALATFLLTFLYLISYPLVQRRLNDLIVARRGEVLG